MIRAMRRLLFLVVGCFVAACAPATQYSAVQSPTAPLRTTAQLRNTQNEEVGHATFTQQEDRVRVEVVATNLPSGSHGIHVHEVGSCVPPDFQSAGAHFNPTNAEHGLANPQGPHAGDLPNLEVGPDGAGRLVAVSDRITISPGPHSLFDADGSSLVVHAMEDDQRADPAGNSGARIACGVIQMT